MILNSRRDIYKLLKNFNETFRVDLEQGNKNDSLGFIRMDRSEALLEAIPIVIRLLNTN